MNKILKLLKDNLTFCIIYAIAVVFYIIGIAGNYQTVTRFFQVQQYSFFNGGNTGVALALVYVIAPIAMFVAAPCVKFFVPENRMKKIATVMAGLFLLIALVACVLLLLLFIVIPDEACPSFTSFADINNLMVENAYARSFNLSFFSMALCLLDFIVLGCYGAATCSE